MIVGSLVAWSAVTAITGAATSFNQFLLLRFALVAAECLFLLAAIELIADRHGPATRARDELRVDRRERRDDSWWEFCGIHGGASRSGW